ncbi:MAG: nucleoside 2-deoxyribosyltransferase [Candidatus Nanoarchaeia archaeon]
MVNIYFAAPLFNAPDKFFNTHLADALERKGHETFLPQRDGFEFSQLAECLQDIGISEAQLPEAVRHIIFLYDMKHQLPKADTTIARLDEPMDPGLLIELSESKRLGKINIGYRTDIRSPYGSLQETYGGAHFFPIYKLDSFIQHPISASSPEQANNELEELANKIDNLSSYRKPQPTGNVAGALFSGIDPTNQKDIEELAKRYQHLKEKVASALNPRQQ